MAIGRTGPQYPLLIVKGEKGKSSEKPHLQAVFLRVLESWLDIKLKTTNMFETVEFYVRASGTMLSIIMYAE